MKILNTLISNNKIYNYAGKWNVPQISGEDNIYNIYNILNLKIFLLKLEIQIHIRQILNTIIS
jgi:hypothetical protein